METNHYTVAIPTREHADTLYYTLKTCINQDYDKLTILVCDNDSQDNTKEIVESFKDSRILYINPGKRLSMSENWEFALNHVSGDYVTFIGDDDGLLMGSINIVDKLFSENNYEAITWKKIEYHWPSHSIPDHRNVLNIYLSDECFVFDSKKMLNKLISDREYYDRLPCIYNSFINVELIKKIKEKYGTPFFRYLSPDVYSSLVIACNVNAYLYVCRPLTINGASTHSSGTSLMRGSKNNTDMEALSFLEEHNQSSQKLRIPTVKYYVMGSFVALEEATGKNLINRPRWVENILKDIQNADPDLYLDSMKLILLHKEIFGIESTLEVLISKYPNKYKAEIYQKGYFKNSNKLSLNAQDFGIFNVFDASIFSSRILQDIKPGIKKNSHSKYREHLHITKREGIKRLQVLKNVISRAI